MKDDDLDLELDDEPVRSERRPAAPTPKVTPTPTPAPELAAAAKPQPVATPTRERKGLAKSLGGPLAWLRDFRWNIRTFLSLLLALVVLVILAENWVPVRFYALGFSFDLPRTLTFVIDLAIGALLMWLWLRRPGRDAGGEP